MLYTEYRISVLFCRLQTRIFWLVLWYSMPTWYVWSFIFWKLVCVIVLENCHSVLGCLSKSSREHIPQTTDSHVSGSNICLFCCIWFLFDYFYLKCNFLQLKKYNIIFSGTLSKYNLKALYQNQNKKKIKQKSIL